MISVQKKHRCYGTTQAYRMIVKLERDNGCHGKGGRSHPHHVIIKAIVPYLRA